MSHLAAAVTATTVAGAVGDDGVGEADTEGGDHGVSVGVNLDSVAVQSGAVWDVVHAALAFFLLKLEGDTTNVVTAAEAAHEVGHVTGDLVAHALGGRHSDIIDHLVNERKTNPNPRKRKRKRKSKDKTAHEVL